MRPSFSFSLIIVSAGSSSRFVASLKEGDPRPASKAFASLQDRPLILLTLENLDAIDWSEIALVIRPSDRHAFTEVLRTLRPAISKKLILVDGGARRQDSVRLGLQALQACDRVAVHDGARPFVSPSFLNRLLEKSAIASAVIPVLPVTDTLKEVDDRGVVVATVKREKFVRVQTPQVFSYSQLLKAHNERELSTSEFTDDAAIVEDAGIEVTTVRGDPDNIKVTTIHDLRLPASPAKVAS